MRTNLYLNFLITIALIFLTNCIKIRILEQTSTTDTCPVGWSEIDADLNFCLTHPNTYQVVGNICCRKDNLSCDNGYVFIIDYNLDKCTEEANMYVAENICCFK